MKDGAREGGGGLVVYGWWVRVMWGWVVSGGWDRWVVEVGGGAWGVAGVLGDRAWGGG